MQRIFMPPTKDEFEALSALHTNQRLAMIYQVSTRTISTWRKLYGITGKQHTIFISRETFETLSPTHTDKEIGSMLGIDTRKVNYWRNKWQVPSYNIPKGNRLYTIDHAFFKDIDHEEKAYILGFIAADGTIHGNGKTLAIAIHGRDRHILESIRTALNSTAPIYTRDVHGAERVVLYLSSKALIADLRTLGITPRKSLVLGYPLLPQGLDQHYIRGLWDGDGYIGRRQFVLCGSQKSLHGVQSALAQETGHILTLAPIGNIFRLTGSRRNKAVLHWLYANSTIFLARKYAQFQSYWQ
jgi:hypothetical protein